MKPFLAPLLLGLALGGTATGLIVHLRHPDPDLFATRTPQTAAQPIPSWSWRDAAVPHPITADSVGTAIAAWRNLRSPDGSPVSAATRSHALLALLVRLSAADFPRLLAALPPPDSDPNRRLLRLAFDCWIDVDAPAAARWALAAGSDYKDFARLATRAWTALDPSSASEWVCSLPPDARARHEILSELVAALGTDDPATLVQTLGVKIWNQSSWALNEPLRAWVKQDPAAALAWFARQPSMWDRAQDIIWLVEAPETARELGAVVAATPDYPGQAAILAQVVLRMSKGKPGDALAWLDEHTTPSLRSEILLSLGTHNYLDPEMALALPPGRIRSQALSHMLTNWSKKDAPAALAWANDHAADPGVVAATAQVQVAQLVEIATAEPATALAEWSTLADPGVQKAALTQLAVAWGQTDPAAALRWQTEQIAALGASNHQPSAYLLAAWAKREPEAALRWTETYLATTSTAQTPWISQQLLGAFAGSSDEKAPFAPTADLYAKIQDSALRTETLTRHVQAWLVKDPGAAKAWLNSNDALTPAQAAALLQTQ